MARMASGTCPHCGLRLNVRQSSIGSLIRCKGCGGKIQVSAPSGPSLRTPCLGCLVLLGLAVSGLFLCGLVGSLIGPLDHPGSGQADTRKIVEQVSAEYEPKIAQARLRIPEDEKLIAAQKDVVVAQTAQIRRAAEQQKLKELEDKLAEDQKAVERLVREQKQEVDRRLGVLAASRSPEAGGPVGKAAGEAPPAEEPIPSLVRPGKTGSSAYDLYPEPWRSRFVKEWQTKVEEAKADVAAAVRKYPEELAAAKKDLAEEMRHAERLGSASGRAKQLQAARELVEQLEKGGAEGTPAYKQAQERLKTLEANDPPYFASQGKKQEAEFAALPAPEQERRRQLRRQRQEWLAKQQEAGESKKLIPYTLLKKEPRPDGLLVIYVLVDEKATRPQVMDLAENFGREYAGRYAFLYIFDSRQACEHALDPAYPDKDVDRHWLVTMVGDPALRENPNGDIKWLAEGRDH